MTGDRAATEAGCLSCAIVRGDVEPLGGAIIETAAFHAHQDTAYPVPGFVIVASRRHIHGIDELGTDEGQEYIDLLQRIRRAQRIVLGCEIVYYFNNEDTRHHFHTWMLPRYAWMKPFGIAVESVRPALQHAQATATDAERLAVLQSVMLLREALRGE